VVYTYYTLPGYTTVYSIRSVLPGTLSPATAVHGEEALGSNLGLLMGMRRIVGSQLPKV